MLARRLNDAPPFMQLRDEMDRLFERFFGDYEPHRAWDPFSLRRFPAVNIWQDQDSIFVESEMPDLTKDDVEITVVGNELTIKGERTGFEPGEGIVMHRRERGAGPFSRIFHLPMEVDEDKVEAAFRNGVLTVTLAKAEIAKPRHIPVKALSP